MPKTVPTLQEEGRIAIFLVLKDLVVRTIELHKMKVVEDGQLDAPLIRRP